MLAPLWTQSVIAKNATVATVITKKWFWTKNAHVSNRMHFQILCWLRSWEEYLCLFLLAEYVLGISMKLWNYNRAQYPQSSFACWFWHSISMKYIIILIIWDVEVRLNWMRGPYGFYFAKYGYQSKSILQLLVMLMKTVPMMATYQMLILTLNCGWKILPSSSSPSGKLKPDWIVNDGDEWWCYCTVNHDHMLLLSLLLSIIAINERSHPHHNLGSWSEIELNERRSRLLGADGQIQSHCGCCCRCFYHCNCQW